jgi:hypothetical protein
MFARGAEAAKSSDDMVLVYLVELDGHEKISCAVGARTEGEEMNRRRHHAQSANPSTMASLSP